VAAASGRRRRCRGAAGAARPLGAGARLRGWRLRGPTACGGGPPPAGRRARRLPSASALAACGRQPSSLVPT